MCWNLVLWVFFTINPVKKRSKSTAGKLAIFSLPRWFQSVYSRSCAWLTIYYFITGKSQWNFGGMMICWYFYDIKLHREELIIFLKRQCQTAVTQCVLLLLKVFILCNNTSSFWLTLILSGLIICHYSLHSLQISLKMCSTSSHSVGTRMIQQVVCCPWCWFISKSWHLNGHLSGLLASSLLLW